MICILFASVAKRLDMRMTAIYGFCLQAVDLPDTWGVVCTAL